MDWKPTPVAHNERKVWIDAGVMGNAEREALEKCGRILAIQCAHYRSRFGEIPMSETMALIDSETMNDDEAKLIADGYEMVVGVLGVLEQAHPKH